MRNERRELIQQQPDYGYAPARPAGISWKTWSMVTALVVIVIIVLELTHLIAPYMGMWGPIIANVAGGTITFLIPTIPICILVGVGLHFWQKGKDDSFKNHLGKPTQEGDYPSYWTGTEWKTAKPQFDQRPAKVPGHYAPSIHNHNDIGQLAKLLSMCTTVEEEKPQELEAQQHDRPQVETFYDLIPYNSLQTGLGIEAVNGKPVLAPIVKSTHFKFIGGSGLGKSCVAAALLDIAMTTNDPEHLRIGLLDLEHNTSRLFEDAPHVAEIGPKKQRLIGRDPDEVAQKLKLLQWELTRRANLGEAYCMKHEPLLLVYVEEMLALKYEVIDKKLNKAMLAAINILGVRGRKYGIFLVACMQTDYSDKSTREGLAMFRTRGGFAIDPDTARASGFHNAELIKENFQRGQSGTYVLEKPQYSGLVLAPEYDVASKLLRLDAPTTRPTTRPTTNTPNYDMENDLGSGSGSGPVVTGELSLPMAPQAGLTSLTAQEKRILQKFRAGMGTKKIISSEFIDASGKPLEGGREFTKRANEIQQLIARFIPIEEEE